MLSSFMLAILFVILMVGVESYFQIYIVKVIMTNKLPSPFTLHCRDKHHNDHINTLKPGESHHFKFVPDPFGKASLWFCSFNWTGAFHCFDIYVQIRDHCIKDICTWDIDTHGPCKTDSQNKCYP
ncbi:putative plant self-incompatibility S1 [Lupinus albus]|uniref:S-protein homolog n=1 Tax=Lupinus albus TaxID=3870 RepID=A0A6A4QGW0_LUPAL|nr:putative plant self-incompatibility S1 [Lupinus albus]